MYEESIQAQLEWTPGRSLMPPKFFFVRLSLPWNLIAARRNFAQNGKCKSLKYSNDNIFCFLLPDQLNIPV